MTLQKQSTETGAWLFRWRSYLPLVFIAVIAPAFREFSYPFGSHFYDLIWEMICLSIAFLGLFIRSYTIGYTPKGTSGRNTKNQVAETLNTSGIYSTVRNPLYLGNFFMMLGVVMFIRVWWVGVIYSLAFWLYYERIIMAEESFLKDKFGKTYEDYLNRTPAFIPKFNLWLPNMLPFSLKNVLKREYPGFFAVISSMTLLELVGDYLEEGAFVLDVVWVSIFSFGLVAYLILRTLKKKTKLLHVEGR